MIVALVSVLAAGYSLGSGVTPTQKVISMMQEMKAKGEAEKEKEAKLYAEYMTWCKDTGVAKSQSIETATNKIESLKATIQKHEAAATELNDAVPLYRCIALRKNVSMNRRIQRKWDVCWNESTPVFFKTRRPLVKSRVSRFIQNSRLSGGR